MAGELTHICLLTKVSKRIIYEKFFLKKFSIKTQVPKIQCDFFLGRKKDFFLLVKIWKNNGICYDEKIRKLKF